jgi:sulfoxide reductase heme-binding subunit YedZ
MNAEAGLVDALWYLGRGTGVMSLLMLTVVVALGVATRSGRPLPGLPLFTVAAVHRSASLLAVSLLAVHVGTLLLDPYAELKLVDLVVPFVGTYRPLWLGLGALASDLLVALVVTSLLRHRLGLRTWRAVHWSAYAAWPVALLHGLGAGSDAGQRWLQVLAGGCLLAVGVAITWRLLNTPSRASLARTCSAWIGLPVAAMACALNCSRSCSSATLGATRWPATGGAR